MEHDAAITELLAKPSLEGLAYLLRHHEMWPASFGPWDWSQRRTCARGLAEQFWPQQVLHLHHTAVDHLFYSTDNRIPGPTDVADRIDRFLATTEF